GQNCLRNRRISSCLLHRSTLNDDYNQRTNGKRMQALSQPNIESELSYAYLHAVASKAGMSCRTGTRHEDNSGIDAALTAWGPFPGGGYLTEIDIKVQLKASIKTPADDGSNFSYFVDGVSRYNDLRSETIDVARFLVVLFLPPNADEWLTHSVDQLLLRRCAYWESLRGAPATSNGSGATIKLPKAQTFTPTALTALATRLSRRDFPMYPAS
ncbi:MAG TPA: DUF4365 domain-containing protein, partial [Candidatus Acidoferrum sp.]|nr:DUF4365 domain-containing protein [Candidatus Acidoferrum sp.]